MRSGHGGHGGHGRAWPVRPPTSEIEAAAPPIYVERGEAAASPFERCIQEAAVYCHSHFTEGEGLKACLYGVMLANELSPESHGGIDVSHDGFRKGSEQRCRQQIAVELVPFLL
jgi:hypothetical protein